MASNAEDGLDDAPGGDVVERLVDVGEVVEGEQAVEGEPARCGRGRPVRGSSAPDTASPWMIPDGGVCPTVEPGCVDHRARMGVEGDEAETAPSARGRLTAGVEVGGFGRWCRGRTRRRAARAVPDRRRNIQLGSTRVDGSGSRRGP
ncbi:hypothetical protein [Rhizobium yanglingense]